MIEVAIMVEGQNGLTWPRWQRLAQAVEALGFVGLYRSDHYTNAQPPDKDSLELWVSLTWLASHTKRIEFGPLVSPVSFRQPTMTVRMATAVDDLSNGRLTLGVGAGWQEREHNNYGWDLLDVGARMDRFEEGLEVMTRLLNSDEPIGYEGAYYRVQDGVALPRPQRPGGPPILIGGNGRKRTLPLTAKYADEWNGVFIPPTTYAELSSLLDELLAEYGRSPSEVRRSLMTGCVFGETAAVAESRLQQIYKRTPAQAQEMGLVVGDGNAIVEQLGRYASAGVQRIMLQWLDLDDLDGLEKMATAVLPQLAGTG